MDITSLPLLAVEMRRASNELQNYNLSLLPLPYISEKKVFMLLNPLKIRKFEGVLARLLLISLQRLIPSHSGSQVSLIILFSYCILIYLY